MVLSVVSTLLSFKPRTTDHTPWLSGASQPWCCPFEMKHHQHSTKACETPVHEPQEGGQKDKGVKSVALLPFSHFNHCLGCLFTHNHPFPSFSGGSMDGKANAIVMSGVVFEKHMMVGVWMVLMSHNEPLHNHNTHHVCLPAFHYLSYQEK